MNLIREAFPSDLPTIHDLAHAVWPEAYGPILSKSQLDYMLDLIYSLPALERQMDEGQRFLLLESDGIPTGFAGFGPMPEANVYKLHKLYVLPGEHGKGSGRSLLLQVLDICRALEGSALLLNVNRHNKARQFYERMGFRVIREEDIPIGQGYFMNDYIMEFPLAPRES